MAVLPEDVDIELPSCPVCHEDYECEQTVPMILECGHSICKNCLDNLKGASAYPTSPTCPTCRAVSVNWQTLPRNYVLEEAVSLIKELKKKKPEKPETPIKCSSCSKIYDESEMFICRNCVKEFHNYDIREPMNPQSQLDVENMGICGNCAIHNHMEHGHETAPFFSISSGFQFASHLTMVTLSKEELMQQISRIGEWQAHFEETSQKVFREIDKMTDMMRKSKTSLIQQNFAENIVKEIVAFSDHVGIIVDAFKNEEDAFLKRFDELRARNEKDAEEKCRETMSKVTPKLCQECGTEYKKDTMYCCQECSTEVKKLLAGTLNKTEFEAINTDHLMICPHCVIANHSGAEHKSFKFADVENSYEIAIRVFRVEKKEETLSNSFVKYAETFRTKSTDLQNYADNIAKMSKIVAECRGNPNHMLVLSDFENTLDQAEIFIQPFTVHLEKDKSQLNNDVTYETIAEA